MFVRFFEPDHVQRLVAVVLNEVTNRNLPFVDTVAIFNNYARSGVLNKLNLPHQPMFPYLVHTDQFRSLSHLLTVLCLIETIKIHSCGFVNIISAEFFSSAHRNLKHAKRQFWREAIRRQRRSVDDEVTVQLLVVVEREMISFHGNQSLEEYVLTVMNVVR